MISTHKSSVGKSSIAEYSSLVTWRKKDLRLQPCVEAILTPETIIRQPRVERTHFSQKYDEEETTEEIPKLPVRRISAIEALSLKGFDFCFNDIWKELHR